MPTFPAVRSLIVPPSQWWSRGKVVTLVSNTPANANFDPAALTDGAAWPACRMIYGTGTTRVDLGVSRTPNIYGVIAHNVDTGLVMGVSNEAGLARGFAARDPNCWIDLRGFPTTARYWDLLVSLNSRGFGAGEIVIATGFEFEGIIALPYDEQVKYWQDRDSTEYGKTYIAASGTFTRALPLRLVLGPDDQAPFTQIVDEAAEQGARMIVVPDTRRNDIWLAEWPSRRAFHYPASFREVEVEFSILDQTPGVRA